MDKEHKDPETIDLRAPRLAQYMHKAWKKHQNSVYWVDINLALKKGLKFYQTRSNASILQGTLPAYCIPKVVRLKTGEVLYGKVCVSPRPPPRSRNVTIGLKKRVRFYWALKIDNYKKKLLDSHKKKLLDKRNSSNQPNQSQNQSVIDQGNLITRKACLLLKVKRPVLKRSV